MWEYLTAAFAGAAGTAILKKYGQTVRDFIMDLARKSIHDKNEIGSKYATIKNSPSVNLIASDNNIVNITQELFATTGFGITKETAVAQTAAMVEPAQIHQQVVKKLKKYLPNTYVAAIIQSYALIRLENNPFPTPESLKNVAVQREKALEGRGRQRELRHRVYNACRSGWVEDILFELAVELEIQDLPRAVITEKVTEAIVKSIDSNPINIYVNDANSDQDILMKIQHAVVSQKRALIRVYARGQNWSRIVKLTEAFAQAHGKKRHVTSEPIGKTAAGCCRIWDPSLSADFFPLERLLEEQFRREMSR